MVILLPTSVIRYCWYCCFFSKFMIVLLLFLFKVVSLFPLVNGTVLTIWQFLNKTCRFQNSDMSVSRFLVIFANLRVVSIHGFYTHAANNVSAVVADHQTSFTISLIYWYTFAWQLATIWLIFAPYFWITYHTSSSVTDLNYRYFIYDAIYF